MRVLALAVLVLASAVHSSAAESWQAATGKHPTSGETFCAVRGGGDLIPLYVKSSTGESSWAVGIGGQVYPGSPLRLTIDGTSFSTQLESFVGRQANEIIAAMKSGKTARFEWAAWPERVLHKGTADLAGFRKVAEQCERELK
jgi:hypothetical protein